VSEDSGCDEEEDPDEEREEEEKDFRVSRNAKIEMKKQLFTYFGMHASVAVIMIAIALSCQSRVITSVDFNLRNDTKIIIHIKF
jgi:hypothetical protein